MADKTLALINNSTLTDIANAIRNKNGETDTYLPSEMADKINAISSGGSVNKMKNYLDIRKSCKNLFNGNSYNGIVTLQTLTREQLDTMIEPNDTENVTDMTSMFQSCGSLESVPAFKTSNVTDMSSMLSGCVNLNEIPAFDTSKVTNMYGMLSSCVNLNEIPAFDTSNVTDMTSMFQSCGSLTSVPAFDTSKVTGMGSMFYSCSALESVPAFDTSNVTSMSYMFHRCSGLESVPAFDTSKVTNMSYMFNGCSRLTSVPAFDTSKVTNIGGMLNGCSRLTAIHMTGMKINFNITSSTKFTREALVEILNNLATVTSTQTLTMGTTNLGKLTDEDKAIATNKGWTLA